MRLEPGRCVPVRGEKSSFSASFTSEKMENQKKVLVGVGVGL